MPVGPVRVAPERADAGGVATAAATLRGGRSEPAGAMRWLRRRIRLVGRAVTAVRGLIPDRFPGWPPPRAGVSWDQ